MIEAPSEIASLLASRPKSQFIADIFTFELRNGTTFRFTSAPRNITLGGVLYKARPKITRGRVKLSRGLSVDTHQIRLDEASGPFLEMAMLGYFNLATYTLGRLFAADARSPWLGPVVRFCGQIASIDEIGSTYAKMTAKSMLNVLDNDFPRVLLQTDCPHVLFGLGCGLSRAAYITAGATQAGSTQNKLLSGVGSQPDGYFAQGVVKFTSGKLNGIAYMVKSSKANGEIRPAYPFLTAPATGDTFELTPGCDKTLATCESKYGYDPTSAAAPHFKGTPFVPDPTTVY